MQVHIIIIHQMHVQDKLCNILFYNLCNNKTSVYNEKTTDITSLQLF